MTLARDAMLTPINSNMAGEDAAIRQLFGKAEGEPFTLADLEAAEAMVRNFSADGKLSPEQEEKFRQARAYFERRAANEEKFKQAPQAYVQNLVEGGRDLTWKDPQKRAAEMKRVEAEIQDARANATLEAMRLKENLRNEEQIQVMWPAKPRPLMIRVGQGQQVIQEPEEIRIGSLRWAYPVGKLVKVPRSVANRLEQRTREYEDQRNRRSILDASGKLKEAGEAARLWQQADQSSKMSSEGIMPGAGGTPFGTDPLA